MTGLSLTVFGQFTAALDDQPLPRLPTVRAQGLLIFLAVESALGTAVQRRETLMELLWPGMPPQSSRKNLRTTLYYLRQAIRDQENLSGQAIPFLLSDRSTIQINPAYPVHLDLQRFLHLLDESSDDWLEAIDIYQDDFLAGFSIPEANSFEEWATARRSAFRRLLLRALEALAAEFIRVGDFEKAEGFARRQLEINSLREPAWRQLMESLARRGRRGEALAEYEACVEILWRELGVEPAAETKQLRQEIVDGLQAEPAPQVITTPAFLSVKEEWAVERPVFVLRQRELERLNRFLESALQEQGRVAFVAGEAGRGKTALLNEFAHRAQEEYPDLVVASGMCAVYTGTGDPYLPFRDILGMLSGDVEAQWRAGTITRDHALRLWHILPQVVRGLLDHGPNLVDTLLPGKALASRAEAYGSDGSEWLDPLWALLASHASRHGGQNVKQDRILEEYAAVMVALARHKPLLLLLEDLHWIDVSSLSLLTNLVRRIKNNRILIVGTYRPEEVARGRRGKIHPLDDVLNEFKRQYGNIILDLDQAASSEGQAFVDALLDSEPNRLGQGFRTELKRHTEGHPLFTVELLRDMQERDVLSRDEAGRWVADAGLTWDELPARVEGVIARRLGHLDSDLMAALQVASVEGERFTAEVVASVLDFEVPALLSQLSGTLSKQHWLVRAYGIRQTASQRLSQYQFHHNLFQQYLYRNLDAVQRAHFHESVGLTLELLFKGELEPLAAQLARHFEEAKQPAKALGYLQMAGDVAARSYAHTEAIAYYGRALAQAKSDPNSGTELEYLYSHLGRQLELHGAFDRALENYIAMEKLARKRGERSMELNALIAQTTLHATFTPLYDPTRAQALSERALIVAQELGDEAAESKILWNLLLVYSYTDRITEAIECGERALAIARGVGQNEQLAYILNDLGVHGYLRQSQFDQSSTVLREARALWRKFNNLPMLADNLAASCQNAFFTGKYEQALALSEEAYGISQSLDNAWGKSNSLLVIGGVYRDWGQPERAISTMTECIRLGNDAGFVGPLVFTRTTLAIVYGDLGATKLGLEAIQMALEAAEKYRPEAQIQVQILGVASWLHFMAGNLAEAEKIVDELDSAKEQGNYFSLFPQGLLVLGQLRIIRQDSGSVLELTDEWLDKLQQNGTLIFLPDAYFLRAKALTALGENERARARLLEAQAAAESLGSRRALWPILSALSQHERTSGSETRAEAIRQQAAETIDYIAKHVDDSELKTSFLARKDVRAVLNPD